MGKRNRKGAEETFFPMQTYIKLYKSLVTSKKEGNKEVVGMLKEKG